MRRHRGKPGQTISRLDPENDKRRKLPNRDTLYQLYVVEQLPVEAIAERCGASEKTVANLVSKLGFRRQQRGVRPFPEATLATMKRQFDDHVPPP